MLTEASSKTLEAFENVGVSRSTKNILETATNRSYKRVKKDNEITKTDKMRLANG